MCKLIIIPMYKNSGSKIYIAFGYVVYTRLPQYNYNYLFIFFIFIVYTFREKDKKKNYYYYKYYLSRYKNKIFLTLFVSFLFDLHIILDCLLSLIISL